MADSPTHRLTRPKLVSRTLVEGTWLKMLRYSARRSVARQPQERTRRHFLKPRAGIRDDQSDAAQTALLRDPLRNAVQASAARRDPDPARVSRGGLAAITIDRALLDPKPAGSSDG